MQYEDSQSVLPDIAYGRSAEWMSPLSCNAGENHRDSEHHQRTGDAVEHEPEYIFIYASAHKAQIQGISAHHCAGCEYGCTCGEGQPQHPSLLLGKNKDRIPEGNAQQYETGCHQAYICAPGVPALKIRKEEPQGKGWNGAEETGFLHVFDLEAAKQRDDSLCYYPCNEECGQVPQGSQGTGFSQGSPGTIKKQRDILEIEGGIYKSPYQIGHHKGKDVLLQETPPFIPCQKSHRAYGHSGEEKEKRHMEGIEHASVHRSFQVSGGVSQDDQENGDCLCYIYKFQPWFFCFCHSSSVPNLLNFYFFS